MPPPHTHAHAHTHRANTHNIRLYFVYFFLLALSKIFVPWLKLQNKIILQLQKIVFISCPLDFCGLSFWFQMLLQEL